MTLWSDDWFENPYPHYARLRASGHPMWLPHNENYSSEGVWLFSRYEDALAIFRQTDAITKDVRSRRLEVERTPFDIHMLNRDGADHARLRRLVSHFFSVQYVNQLEPVINAKADALVSKMLEKGAVDLVADFAEPLPLQVIAHLMGIPSDDVPQVRKWSKVLSSGADSVLVNTSLRQQRNQALSDFVAYIERMTVLRSPGSSGDMITYLRQATLEGKLTQEEMVGSIAFLLFAGHETTVSLIANGLWLLLTHPEQWALIQRRPKLLPSAVEEILRFESPTQRSTYRFATQPLEISGFCVAPGQQIAAIIGSANRDNTVFQNPDVFDITRSPNRHLAFGLGIHNCQGKTLARLEARVALQKLLSLDVPIRLLSDGPCWRRNSFFRGIEGLSVVFE